MPVQIEVRYFAMLSQLAGTSAERVEIDPDTTVASLWSLLERRHPSLRGLKYRPLVACDMSYAGWDTALSGVAEVAFLPPVSGG
jgi:molybdopterin converting factor subunit 1